MPRKISEIFEEFRQMPHGGRAEGMEQLIIAHAQDINPRIEKARADTAMRRLEEVEIHGEARPE